MLLPTHLDIQILVVVLVQCRYRSLITDPEINGIGFLLQCDPSKGDVSRYVFEKTAVLLSQVVVFWTRVRIGLQ